MDFFPKRYIYYSIIFHFFVTALFLILPKIYFNKEERFIREYVRVDIVGMPKFTPAELKKIRNKNIKIGQKNIGKKIPKENKPNIKGFLKKMAKKGRKIPSKIVEEELSEEWGDTESGDQLREIALEGNKISKGTSIVGGTSSELGEEYEIYLASIPSMVRPYWKLPSYLLSSDLKARVRIYVTSSGKIVRYQIIQSSKNKDFDARALKAVRDASPLVPPSESLKDTLLKEGVVLGFPL